MGETRQGQTDELNLLEGCPKKGHSRERNEAYEMWDKYYGTGSYDFIVYALLDDRYPGPYIFGPLTFTHSPFYIGHGNAKKRAQKSSNYLQQAGEYNLKVKKMAEIYKVTGNPYMRTKSIGSFKTKNKAALVERKIIQLIMYEHNHMLYNSAFNRCHVPLTKDDYKLMNPDPNHIITM